MISEKEYLTALETVRDYMKQIDYEISVDKIKVKDWIKMNDKRISVRLYNVLIEAVRHNMFQYIHEVNLDLYKIRNFGKRSHAEIENLLGKKLK